MKAKVLGIKSVDYVSKKTGQPVQGAELHIVRDLTSREVGFSVGQAVGTIFISAKSPLINLCKPAMIGKECEFVYDYDGRFSSLSDIVLPAKA